MYQCQKKYIDLLLDKYGNEITNCYLPSYVFCTIGNIEENSYMWKKYGDNGNGVAIEFDSKNISKSILNGPLFYAKILYDLSEYPALINQLLNVYYEKAVVTCIKDPESFNSLCAQEPSSENIIMALMDCFYKLILSYKDPEWKDEQEWRLFCRYSKNFTPTEFQRRDGTVGHCIYIRPNHGIASMISALHFEEHAKLLLNQEEKLPHIDINKLMQEPLIHV